MEQPDIEPDWRIERSMLVDAQPSQFIEVDLAIFLAEIAIPNTPIRDGSANAMNKLADGGFPLRGVLLPVKVFGYHDLGGQERPRLGHLDVLLLEDHLAVVVGDFGHPLFPFDLVERFDGRAAKDPRDAQRFASCGNGSSGSATGCGEFGTAGFRGRLNSSRDLFTSINHRFAFVIVF